MEHYRKYHCRENPEDDSPEEKIPIKHLFGGEFVEETLVNHLNNLVEQLPNTCRDPEEILIEQEEEQIRILGWPEITKQDWDDPEQALLSCKGESDKKRFTVFSHLTILTAQQRRLAWNAYQERRTQCIPT